MSKNAGTVDRVLRVVVGIGLISIVFWGPKTNWGYFGLIPLLTGMVGMCPIYSILGIRTCPMKKNDQ